MPKFLIKRLRDTFHSPSVKFDSPKLRVSGIATDEVLRASVTLTLPVPVSDKSASSMLSSLSIGVEVSVSIPVTSFGVRLGLL